MAFVKVKLIVEGRSYTVEVEEDADPKKLARGLVEGLRLPRDEEYRLHLVDALRIHEGAILKLVRVEPDELYRKLEEDRGGD